MNWFALQTRSRFEFTVRDALLAAGVEAFLPTWQEQTRYTDRIAEVIRPLFTGYLFARFPAADSDAIRATRGVSQVLSMGQIPVAVPDEDIENLQRIVAMPVKLACCPYVAGARITVLRGPFAGVCGVVTRVRGRSTLSIPVEILGRSVSVQIDAADVRETSK